jgi:hypothetical protein
MTQALLEDLVVVLAEMEVVVAQQAQAELQIKVLKGEITPVLIPAVLLAAAVLAQ